MMRVGAFLDDLAWVVLVPPAITIAWWFFGRGWTNLLGTTGSERVKGWVRSGTWIILVTMYLISFALLAYKYLVLK